MATQVSGAPVCTILTDEFGIPKGVMLDDVLIPSVALASVNLSPGEALSVTVKVYVTDVKRRIG